MKYLSNYIDEAKGNLYQKHGAFYAFSASQFNEQAEKGRQYVQIADGLICPKDTADAFMSEFEAIIHQAVEQDIRENGPEAIVEREYFNHECQYSLDRDAFDEALEVYKETFPSYFSQAMINRVADACYKKAVRNDWF